ncbi:MAG: zinc ribbon domain-containing protein, partial [Pisciglobus halotolerans]|nr:zinc ribbon domain-containing protein [Pisciglobus halotolerans]
MAECPCCNTTIKGDWNNCPLCGHELFDCKEDKLADPYPLIPLRYNRSKVVSMLMVSSIIIGIIFLVIEALWLDHRQGLQLSIFGIVSLWTVVYVIIRKRRNVAKSVLYLIFIASLISIYLDYTTKWSGWSLTYAIPIICIFSIIAMYISVKFVNLEVGDYIMYLLLATLIGLVPTLFLVMNWVTNPIPAKLSIGI